MIDLDHARANRAISCGHFVQAAIPAIKMALAGIGLIVANAIFDPDKKATLGVIMNAQAGMAGREIASIISAAIKIVIEAKMVVMLVIANSVIIIS